MFLPTTRAELRKLGWDTLDVILVTGDAYIDSPLVGVALIGKVLTNAGYRVGIIGQPDMDSAEDIRRLGEPGLFWGVTGGCVDSMVANRTASGKKRRADDYTPGGVNDRRPDRATIAYSNLIRKHFKNTKPLVLGGIEASLRRVAHYDFWSDKIRKSILFDAKADYLLYGMAERSVVELANCLRDGGDLEQVRGLCYVGRRKPDAGLELPSFSECAENKNAFAEMFRLFYENNDPVTAARLFQQQDSRYLVQNPPPHCLSKPELDAVHAMEFERGLHPFHEKKGKVKALETIRFSISTHRGCYGECRFCAIAIHQGRTVQWRSERSILEEAGQMAKHSEFKGIIQDVGGPTANMYGFECSRKTEKGACPDKRCLFPEVCSALHVDHHKQVALLEKLRMIKGVRKVFIGSGIRHDMVLADKAHGKAYMEELVPHHVSGQLKVAPEHSEARVLELMGKPGPKSLLAFRDLFQGLTRKAGKKQYLTYYLIAAHPGCTIEDMGRLERFAVRELKLRPEQVQVFTPTPSTYSTLMYWTERDPFSGRPIFVEKGARGREKQKQRLTGRQRR